MNLNDKCICNGITMKMIARMCRGVSKPAKTMDGKRLESINTIFDINKNITAMMS